MTRLTTRPLTRRTLLRGLGAAALVVPAGAVLAGCSSVETPGSTEGAADLLSTAREQGFIRVAIANEPPYTQVNPDGTVTGAEPDVFRAVCAMLDIPEIQGTVTPYESMIPGLNANRWDAITAGLFMKESRCAEVAYTEPVIVSTESFAVPAGNPQGLMTIDDVLAAGDVTVAILPGSFEEGILTTAGVPDGQLIRVDDGRSGVEAVAAGRAAAFLLPTLSLEALQGDGASGFDITEPLEDAPATGSGAAVRMADTSFLDAYNEQLTAFKDTAEFEEILDMWGFDAEAARSVTAEELCANPG